MQLLMTSVDSLQQDTYRLLGYEKQLAKNTQAKQQLVQKKVRVCAYMCVCVCVWLSQLLLDVLA